MTTAIQVSPQLSHPLLCTPERQSFYIHLKFILRCAKSLVPLNGVSNNVCCQILHHSKDKGVLHSKTTKVIRATLNPIWNMPIDFGIRDPTDGESLQFIVRHIGFFRNKDIGEVVLPVTSILNKSDVCIVSIEENDQGEWFSLVDTRFTSKDEKHPSIGTLMIQFQVSYKGQGTVGSKTRNLKKCSEEKPIQNTKNKSNSQENIDQGIEYDQRMLIKSTNDILPSRKDQLLQMKSCHSDIPFPGEIWMIIEIEWLLKWLDFVSCTTPNALSPGPISNILLMNDQLSPTGKFQIRSDVLLKIHYRIINLASWNLLYGWYGGGPLIKIEIPRHVKDTKVWVEQMILHQVASQ